MLKNPPRELFQTTKTTNNNEKQLYFNTNCHELSINFVCPVITGQLHDNYMFKIFHANCFKQQGQQITTKNNYILTRIAKNYP